MFRLSHYMQQLAEPTPVRARRGPVRPVVIWNLTRRCNLHLRQACWSAALGSLKTPASRRFYDRKRSEGKSHHQAVIALARTQLRVLWTMLRAGTLFSAERALEAA